MAPEVMRQEEFNEKADVYSFGLILYELISGEELFPQYEYPLLSSSSFIFMFKFRKITCLSNFVYFILICAFLLFLHFKQV